MFTGRRYDPETELYYCRARMYNPTIGRFLQPDPIGYGDGMNIYAYCGNNPINYIDPWGLADLRIHPPVGSGTRDDPYRITSQDIIDTMEDVLGQLGDDHFFSYETVNFDSEYFHGDENNQKCFKVEDGPSGLVTGHDINYMVVGARAGYQRVPYGFAATVRGGYSVSQWNRLSTENEIYFYKLGYIYGRYSERFYGEFSFDGRYDDGRLGSGYTPGLGVDPINGWQYGSAYITGYGYCQMPGF
jgi:RHS repeat-associated protein